MIHDQIDPTIEMFRTSAPDGAEPGESEEGDEDHCDLTTWRAAMSLQGFSTYYEERLEARDER